MKFCSRAWRQNSGASFEKAMWWTMSGLSCLSLTMIGVMSLIVVKL